MKMLKTTLLLFAVLAFVTSCSKKLDYDAVAAEYCACTKALMDMNAQFQQMVQDTTKQAEALAMFEGINAEVEKTQACVKGLDEKYKMAEKAEDKAATMQAMQTACPEVAALMNELGKQ